MTQHCEHCGDGWLVPLGARGAITHYRCRDCGAMYSADPALSGRVVECNGCGEVAQPFEGGECRECGHISPTTAEVA